MKTSIISSVVAILIFSSCNTYPVVNDESARIAEELDSLFVNHIKLKGQENLNIAFFPIKIDSVDYKLDESIESAEFMLSSVQENLRKIKKSNKSAYKLIPYNKVNKAYKNYVDNVHIGVSPKLESIINQEINADLVINSSMTREDWSGDIGRFSGKSTLILAENNEELAVIDWNFRYMTESEENEIITDIIIDSLIWTLIIN